jgi:hypothetical protein
MNDIDKLFQDAFADAKMPVNDAVWNTVQTEMHGKGGSSVIRKGWILLLLLLIAGGFCVYYITKADFSAPEQEVKTDLDQERDLPVAYHQCESKSDKISTESVAISKNLYVGASELVVNRTISNTIMTDQKKKTETKDNHYQVEMTSTPATDMTVADAAPNFSTERNQQELVSIGSLRLSGLSPISNQQLNIKKSLNDIALVKKAATDDDDNDMTLAEKVFDVASENSGKLTGRLVKSSAVQDIFSIFGR